MKISKEYGLFLSLSLVISVISNIGFNVYALTSILSKTLPDALKESNYNGHIDEHLTEFLMMIAPFMILGWIAAFASHKKNILFGWCLYIGGLFPLVWLYYSGHTAYCYAIKEQAWTGAALSVGLLPFLSIPILVFGLAIGWLLFKFIAIILKQKKISGNE